MLVFTNPLLFFARALPKNIFSECACLISPTYCVIQNCWNIFPEEIRAPSWYLCCFWLAKFLPAHLFMLSVLYVFYKRRWDSPLFTFPSGQGRQVFSPTYPCAPSVQPHGSQGSSCMAGGGPTVRICVSSLLVHEAWMNQQLLHPDHPHSYL